MAVNYMNVFHPFPFENFQGRPSWPWQWSWRAGRGHFGGNGRGAAGNEAFGLFLWGWG